MATPWDTLPDAALLKASEIVSKGDTVGIVGVSNSKWWALVKAGKAPAPHFKDSFNTKWRLGDIRAWLKAQGDPTEPLAELDPANDLQSISGFDALLATVHAPNVEFITFKKAGHRGALTMIIGHRQGKVTKETFLWVPPKS